ncbi:PQQ-dependent sugar dehydrogenase [Novosphingobium terrae]|uniref:PQQ-dependent sugar dehydrogenase n=1 Tax=Novosphingobium terrae TaxID=2726189 RepID=UPI00197CDF9D|nr:PQQ-dependent sugar dehydrogenase [Novosphingobium terrae]
MPILRFLRQKVSLPVSSLMLIGVFLYLCFYLLLQPRDNFSAYWAPEVRVGHDQSGSIDLRQGGLVTALESNALPIRLEDIAIRDKIDLPLQGGAIAKAGHDLLLLDRLGSTWLVSGGGIRPSGLPKLPLNVDAFVKHAAFPLDPSSLQAHDIKVRSQSGQVYASFEAYDEASGATRFTLARSKGWPGPHPSWEIIFQGPLLHSQEFYSGRAGGGKLAFKDNALIFAIGDYNLDTSAFPVAQDLGNPWGKIYSMDLASGRVELVSRGHRVPLGLVVAPNGDIWETENGPRGGDELNRIIKGRNYGWPFETSGQNYFSYVYHKPGSLGKALADTLGMKPSFEDPVYAWVPAVAVSQIVLLKGFDPAWDGDFLVGSLKGQSLYRIRIKDGRVLFSEPIRIGHRVRDIVQDGPRIIIWTDEGTLLVLSRDQGVKNQSFPSLLDHQDSSLAECTNCHTLSGDQSTDFGPALAGVYGRNIASSDYQHYSPALKSMRQGVWDEQILRQFIKNPSSIAPGTTMPILGVPEDRLDNIMAALKRRKAGS